MMRTAVLSKTIACAGLLAACTTVAAVRDGRAEAQPIDGIAALPADRALAALDAEIAACALLCADADRARAGIAESGALARAETAGGAPLTGARIEDLQRRFRDMLALVRELAAVSERHAAWINRQDAAIEARTIGAALSLAASTTMLDAWMTAGRALTADEGVRRALNRGDLGWGVDRNQLDAMSRAFLDLGTRIGLRAQAHWLASGQDRLAALARDGVRGWLRERLEASPSYASLRGFWLVAPDEAVAEGAGLLASDLRRLGDALTGGVSKGVGNTIGAVAWRSGRLHGDRAAHDRIRALLRPGDVVLEKTPFRLTDRFIPGHFGHAAVWVGGWDEVAALGLAGDPLALAHRAELEQGRGMAEALRQGVMLNTLERFLDIDDLCILRPALPAEERREAVRRALRQLGKDYDFTFDVETTDRIVCSELVYQVHTAFPWPTSRSLGHATISPDQVAKRGADGTFAVIALWRDGKPMEGDLRAELARLIAP